MENTSVKIIEVIEVRCTRGRGIDSDPVRECVQYWTKEGSFIAHHDPQDMVVGYKPQHDGITLMKKGK